MGGELQKLNSNGLKRYDCITPYSEFIHFSIEVNILTPVRYKLVLFPKEGKPCGRNYIELTLFLAQLP